jgi:hypothetical protein
MLEYKTQIIKLQNGDDLIANVTLNGMDYILDEPMSFGLDLRGHNSNLVMRHYLPVQLVKKNQMQINMNDVLTVLEPEEEFCEYYINTVVRLRELLRAKSLVDDLSDEEIQDMINNFEDMDHDGVTLH